MPKWSTDPRPLRPSTPEAWASSTIMMAPYFSARRGQLVDGADVAVHGEDAVGDDELASGLSGELVEKLLAVGYVFVAEDLDGGAGEARAVDNAGVVELVGEDEIFFAEDGAYCASVGGKTALEDDAGFDVFETGDLFLQIHVDAHGSGDGAHRSRAHAKGARGGHCGLNQPGVVGQAQVVVAGQVDDLAAVVVADRGLLVVEDAELEAGAFGAEFVENCGQMGQLGARRGLSHGYLPQRRSITPHGEADSPFEYAASNA